MATQAVCDQDPDVAVPESELSYPMERDVLGRINALAGVTPQELSGLYVFSEYTGPDVEWEQKRLEERTQNQEQLRRIVEERYGADLLGVILDAYDDQLADREAGLKRGALILDDLDAHEASAVGHVQIILNHLEDQGRQFEKMVFSEEDPSGEQRRAFNQQTLAHVRQHLEGLHTLPYETRPDLSFQ